MLTFKLALRNLFRSFRRTLLTMFTVVVGVLALVAAYGLVHGIQDTMARSNITTEMGHIRILNKGYLKEKDSFPLDINTQQPDAVVAALTKQFPKVNAFKRIIFDAKISDGVHGLQARAMIGPIDKMSKAFKFLQPTKGTFMPAKGNLVLIGAKLAKTFKKKVGDTVTIEGRTRTGSLNAVDFKIHGIFDTGNPLLDGFTIYIAEGPGRRFLQMPKATTDVVVVLDSRKQTKAAAAAALAAAKGNQAYTWIDADKEMEQINGVRKKMFNFMIAVIMLLAAAGMFNTMMMAGYERRGEIGMMLAMGMKRSKIIQLFAVEASFVGLMGSVVGAVFGAMISLHYQSAGLNAGAKSDAMAGSSTSMSMPSTFYFQFNPSVVVIGLLIGVSVCVLAAIWPALRITKEEPKDILAGS